MMQFDVLTLFPDLFESFRTTGVLGRAVEKGLVSIEAHDLRAWSGNRWGQVDDEPYGGGAGMVIQAPPVLRAVRDIADRGSSPPVPIVLSPRGRVLDQAFAESLVNEDRLLLLCGRYEGFDERVCEILRPLEVSIGDFILGGGEVPAMVLIEVLSRLVPGVVGDPQSVEEDSFANHLLDFPCFTRPLDVEGRAVPTVLRSGDHGKIRRWRLERSIEATVERRPDLVRANWKAYPDDIRRLIWRFAPDLAESLDRVDRREE